jgi:hypothetical protein
VNSSETEMLKVVVRTMKKGAQPIFPDHVFQQANTTDFSTNFFALKLRLSSYN